MWRSEESELGQRDEEDGGLAGAVGWIESRADRFDRARPIFLARAPGRIDLMGGIGDYSGALVLELPIAAATWVAAQAAPDRTVTIESEGAGALGVEERVSLPLEALVPDAPLDYAEARARLGNSPGRAWAAYALGALVFLHRDAGRPIRHGLRILVRSDVPAGKGVSSSAALEVAALEALAPLAGAALEERALALAAQKVENFVVGAPCGVMDQMTSACGRRDHLLALLCQPAELVGHLLIPHELEVFGIDSGIRHAVSGADYGTVRTAAFMGYRIIADAIGFAARPVSEGHVSIDDRLFGGYLANVEPPLWRARYRALVPEWLGGRDFLARYGGITDPATRVDPDRTYPVRAATEHPIEEHYRVGLFRALLAASAETGDRRRRLGELMYAAHASYSACGLGSDGTDRLVDLVRAAGPEARLYGAKITGGGSGGTVAVLAERGARAAVESIAARYAKETGRAAAIFSGSSSGARAFGTRKLVWQGELTAAGQIHRSTI
jgi:L-arabinokinase